ARAAACRAAGGAAGSGDVAGAAHNGGVTRTVEERGTAEATLRVLLTGDRERDCLVHLQHVPPRPAVHGTWPAWADPDLVAGYRGRGVELPWQHQTEAAEHVWSGRHVVLATATGSGKSLPAWLAAVTTTRSARRTGRLSDVARRPTTLYLSPTKALAARSEERRVGKERRSRWSPNHQIKKANL